MNDKDLESLTNGEAYTVIKNSLDRYYGGTKELVLLPYAALGYR